LPHKAENFTECYIATAFGVLMTDSLHPVLAEVSKKVWFCLEIVFCQNMNQRCW